MKKIICIVIIVIIFLIGLLLFINKNEEKDNLTKVTVAEVTHSAFYAPWYVAIEKGTYLYNPEDHSLELKFDEDLRAWCGLQDFVASAPLTIIFVANRDKIKGKDERGVTETIYVDTGFISQNIYLYCASESLANVVRAMIDKEALSKKLHLSDNQEITLAHTIGRFPPRE